MNEEVLFFVEFCVKSLSEELELNKEEICKLINEDTDILQSYIIPCYEPLHTQGKRYIVNDLLEVLKEEGAL